MKIILKYFSDFSNTQLEQLSQLEALYKEWNEKINVISRKEPDSLYEKHVLHSLSIAAAFELNAGMQVVDLGTGGGFPGIPLAIYFPEVKFHLVDSIGKKIKVVKAVSEAIGLKNLTAEHSRIEDIKNRQFDLVLSRAVAPIKELLLWSKHLMKKPNAQDSANLKGAPNGLICLKGGDLANEISESGKRPRVIDIYQLFPEEFFKEKYILHIPR